MPATCSIVIALSLLTAACAFADTAVMVIRPDDARDILNDDAWTPLPGADRLDEAFVCDNGEDGESENGFYQYVTLDQSRPMPIIATAYSKAEGVGGRADAGYSLYLEVVCADGTPLMGNSASFQTGTHDWQKRQVLVLPQKPIRSVGVRLKFNDHTGQASFRRPSLIQVPLGEGEAMLDDMFVRMHPSWKGGFAVRDAAADSDFQAFGSPATASAPAAEEAMGLKLVTSARREGDATMISATLSSDEGRDRAVTLIYAVPFAGADVRWLVSPRRDEATVAPKCYLTTTRTQAGSGAGISRYPLAAVATGRDGRAVALDMSHPAVFRVGYSTTGLLYIAFDLALTVERPAAEVAFCEFGFDAEWGLRSAMAKFYGLYGEQFIRRVPKMGVWMPFRKISEVDGWEDFGFAFKESNNETAWDDQHGILTFHYTEPMTWWMKMPPETPRTLTDAAAQAAAMAETGDPQAQALITSGYRDETGQFVGRLANTPWADGTVYSMNSSPGIAGKTTDFSNKWNPDIRRKLYGPDRQGDLDGEYIDSAEAGVTTELDFCREHFATARTPLTFSAESFRPAVHRWLIVFEYIRAIAADVHGMGKLMMANSTPGRVCWLAPLLDVCGTETDWNRRGEWRPMSDEEMLYRRAMCGPKPYCFLMNTDFDAFGADLTDLFMKRCAAYGMFPGFFSANASTGHYFSRPELYQRDRELFRRYVPLCRTLAEAGWQPVTLARSDNPSVHVERFGARLLTVYNDSDEPAEATVALLEPAWAACHELLADKAIDITGGKVKFALDVWDLAVLRME